MKRNLSALLVLLGIIAFSASTGYSAEPPANWGKHCTICHGKDGKGQTKAGQKAGVKDLTDAKVQGSFTDDQAFKSIKDGMEENGKQKMKAFKDKLSDDDIKQLVAFVRTLKS